jgi:molybdopterin synthase catalytic subunit
MLRTAPSIDVQVLDRPVERVPFGPFPEAGGGECVFLGRTRREVHPDHGALTQLEYHGYRPLAERTLAALAEQACEQYGCLAVRVHHALGAVAVGQASVLVQVACPHRDAAFAACRFLIDRLKATAPIWKRERWADGTTWAEGVAVEP